MRLVLLDSRVRLGTVWRLCLSVVALGVASAAHAQLPSALYSWETVGNTHQWAFAFGGAGGSASVSNGTLGELTIVETSTTPGASVAFADAANRVRESSTAASGGLDLTGLDWLEFDIGHNGSGPINVQFYTQAASGTGPSANYTFSGLGPDLAIAPGVATYRVPLAGLPPDQLVYIRQFGVQVREHAAVGNVTWTLREVRSGGTPLTTRDLITHSDPTNELGLQGAIVNFDNTAVQGNDGGQNQTGLSHNPAGTGSLEWTDVGGSNGAAITWGNGTPWGGNSFNHRTTDLGGYTQMIVRMSATDPLNGGGTVGIGGMLYTDGFMFRSLNGGAGATLPVDGQFHDLKFSLEGVPGTNVTDWTGINVFGHSQDLVMNVDNIRFRNVQFVEHTLFSWENSLEGWATGPEPGHAHSIVSTGATHGATALQLDRTAVRGNGSTDADDAFVVGSQFTTTDLGVIDDLVTRINGASSIAFDVTYEDQLPVNPSFTSFYVAFADDTGAIYRGETGGIQINGAAPGTTTTLQIPIESFLDTADGSTKTLAVDGLAEDAETLSIFLISNTDYGGVYQIDNFRVISEVTPGPELAADFDGDFDVDAADLAAWSGAFGQPGNAAGDADDDGDSDGADFLAWQRELGPSSSTAVAGAVPEPGTWWLAVLGMCAAAVIVRQLGTRPMPGATIR